MWIPIIPYGFSLKLINSSFIRRLPKFGNQIPVVQYTRERCRYADTPLKVYTLHSCAEKIELRTFENVEHDVCFQFDRRRVILVVVVKIDYAIEQRARVIHVNQQRELHDDSLAAFKCPSFAE